MLPSSVFTWVLGALLACVASTGGGYYLGLGDGKASNQARADAKAVTDLTSLIESHADLVKRSGVASKALRLATAQRAAQDAQSTQEIKDALQASAPERVGCVFPAGVMRQLAAARDRAAQAAASGIRNALPGTAASAADHR